MRGNSLYEGLQFTATKMRDEQPPSPSTYFNNALLVQAECAEEFEARNNRITGISTLQIPTFPTNYTPRKKAYINRVWGHVPTSNINNILKEQKLTELRKGGKTKC